MSGCVRIPASLDAAEATVVTQGQWLTGEMEARGLRGIDLFRQMTKLGFEGISPNIVTLWRKDESKIGLETLPTLLEALGMDEEERRCWVVLFTGARYPALAPYLQVAA